MIASGSQILQMKNGTARCVHRAGRGEGGGGTQKKRLVQPHTLYAAGERAERDCITARGATRSGVHASEVKEKSASSAECVALRHPQEAQGRGRRAAAGGYLAAQAGRQMQGARRGRQMQGARRGQHICTSLRNPRRGATWRRLPRAQRNEKEGRCTRLCSGGYGAARFTCGYPGYVCVLAWRSPLKQTLANKAKLGFTTADQFRKKNRGNKSITSLV